MWWTGLSPPFPCPYKQTTTTTTTTKQDLQPLEWAFAWADLFSPLHFLSLLEGELFPKWLGVLHAWLGSPSADFAEVRGEGRWMDAWMDAWVERYGWVCR